MESTIKLADGAHVGLLENENGKTAACIITVKNGLIVDTTQVTCVYAGSDRFHGWLLGRYSVTIVGCDDAPEITTTLKPHARIDYLKRNPKALIFWSYHTLDAYLWYVDDADGGDLWILEQKQYTEVNGHKASRVLSNQSKDRYTSPHDLQAALNDLGLSLDNASVTA